MGRSASFGGAGPPGGAETTGGGAGGGGGGGAAGAATGRDAASGANAGSAARSAPWRGCVARATSTVTPAASTATRAPAVSSSSVGGRRIVRILAGSRWYGRPMPSLRVYQVDAFSDRPFAGNPAAVCPLAAPIPEALMQDVAAENNLAETAFFHPQGDAFSLRWFTPTTEVDLCGHATLASAFVLMTELEPARTKVVF